MTAFAQRCGVHDARRAAVCAALLDRLREERPSRVRVAWCDMHGVLRGKTLMPAAVEAALADGVGMVATLMLKDTSDRTVYPIFEPSMQHRLPAFAGAANLVLLPDPESYRRLPWAEDTGWLQGQPWFADCTPVPQDTRRVLQHAVDRLASAGCGLRVGLEVEFHIHRIVEEALDPAGADWPGEAPTVRMLHPGYNLLAEGWADRADDALRIVQRTAQGLGLPLRSLEVELGPSQFEAVFEPLDALDAADAMVVFRNGVRQALHRAGYHASFVCRPPLPNVMASGWHVHQSLVDRANGRNAFTADDALLSPVGRRYLAGLLARAKAAAVFATPTVNGFSRFRPNALAPVAVSWGRDNRGAMLRVIGAPGDGATRIENRLAEPMANPYLLFASQIHCGLDGIERGDEPPAPTDAPYRGGGESIPTSLGEALDALEADDALVDAMGRPCVEVFIQAKRAEAARFAAASDPDAWQRREYFSRF